MSELTPLEIVRKLIQYLLRKLFHNSSSRPFKMMKISESDQLMGVSTTIICYAYQFFEQNYFLNTGFDLIQIFSGNRNVSRCFWNWIFFNKDIVYSIGF